MPLPVPRRYYEPVLIREATATDWPGIEPIFRAVVEQGTTYAYPSGLTSEQARALWMGRGRVVVAVDPDGDGSREIVLGTATMGPNLPGRGAHVATASFMVAQRVRGRGVGRALGEHMVAWATAQGFRAVQLNAVVQTNTAAVALWRSLGFGIVGTVPEAFRPRGARPGRDARHAPVPAHGLTGVPIVPPAR